MTSTAPQPPSYDVAIGGVSYPSRNQDGYHLVPSSSSDSDNLATLDIKKPDSPETPNARLFMPTPQPYPTLLAGPSTSNAEPSPTVYHYQNPKTKQVVTSFLPPDHPATICLQTGKHKKKTVFGVVGVLASVFWFPMGLAVCLLDRKTTCERCGEVLHDSLILRETSDGSSRQLQV